MDEYITKQQAIDLAESLRPIAGNGITDAFINGIEGLEGHEMMEIFNPKQDFNLNKASVCKPYHGVWYRTPMEGKI